MRRLVNVIDTATPEPTREQLVEELKALRDAIAKRVDPFDAPGIFERSRTYQNVGGYMLRAARLDSLIRELSKEPR